MSQWLSQLITKGEQVNDWLAPVRQEALGQLKAQGWPSKRAEAWRFTPLTPIEKRGESAVQPANEAATIGVINDLDAIDIVVAGGHLLTDVSAIALPDGVKIVSFADATVQEQEEIKSVLGQVKPAQHLFGLVNDAVCQQGIFLKVDDNVEFTTPVKISQLVTGEGEQHFRLVVTLGENAKATVIEHGEGDIASLNTAFSEYEIGAHGQLEHYRFALFTDKALQVGGVHFKLHEKADINSTLVGYGSQLSRLDVDIHHAGEFANAKMNAIYLLAEGELFDLHSTIEHAVPNCTSEENARGIVGDKARAIFNGRIHIHRDAQKTLAELNNRNLLLSRRALVNTKPELEIYADDVRCAHGATVAEIEEKALYYLLTRGISRSRALVMLNFGFIQELVNQIPNSAIRDWIAPKLRERFVAMEVK